MHSGVVFIKKGIQLGFKGKLFNFMQINEVNHHRMENIKAKYKCWIEKAYIVKLTDLRIHLQSNRLFENIKKAINMMNCRR